MNHPRKFAQSRETFVGPGGVDPQADWLAGTNRLLSGPEGACAGQAAFQLGTVAVSTKPN